MKVIHDDEMGGIMTIPLIFDWGISKNCQIDGCDEKTSTIVCFSGEENPTGQPIHLGICEKHYRESMGTGRFDYKVNV